MNKLFVDSDIILDVLTRRGEFYAPAAEIFDLAYAKELRLYTTAVVLANVFYLLRKKYGTEKSRECLKSLRLVMGVLPVTEKTVDEAMLSGFADFEDGLQYFAAKENEILVIITRNVRDYRERDLVVQTAGEYLDTLAWSGGDSGLPGS